MTEPHARLTDAEIIAGCADELPIGVWVARAPGGEEVYANKKFAEIMGVPALGDVAVGEYSEPYGIYTRSGALYPEDRLPFVRALEEQRDVMVDDIVIHRRDGRQVYIRAYARPVADSSGAISHVVVAFIDITREVQAETGRDDFLSAASHELKTPIGALQIRIQSLADRLRQGAALPVEVLSSSLDACERQIRRIARLAEELLDVARIRSGRIDLQVSDVDLAALVREAVARLADDAARAGSTVSVRAPEAMPGRSDPLRIDQLLTNLVANAIKYGDGKAIDVELDRAGPRALITVRDRGIGIDGVDHQRIFVAFERAVSRRNYAGMGARALDRQTDCRSARRDDRRVEPQERGRHLPRRAAVAVKGTVLIVDDDEDFRSTYCDVLTLWGYTCAVCGDGAEALRLLRDRVARDEPLPSLILLDLMMPVMNGWELREAQLGDPSLRAIPVVVITADLQLPADTLNADGVLSKLTLRALVTRYCG